NLRLFTMCLGEVQEHARQEFDRRKVRHIKTVGMNTLRAHAQRKADEQARLNLRQMIKRIEHTIIAFAVRRLVLAGSPDITAQFRNLLPKRLSSRIIGTVDIAIDATAETVRSAAAPLAEKFERETEEALVTDLVTSAAKAGDVVMGLAHTVHALNEGRVWQL